MTMIVKAFRLIIFIWSLLMINGALSSATPGKQSFQDISGLINRTLGELNRGKQVSSHIKQILTLLESGNLDDGHEVGNDKPIPRESKSQGAQEDVHDDFFEGAHALVRRLGRVIAGHGVTENVIGILDKETNRTESVLPVDGDPVDYAAMGCGVRNELPVQGRILGGDIASPGEFPWHVALVDSVFGNIICAASLINTRYLLTVAHCTEALDRIENTIEAWLGVHILTFRRERYRIVRRISHIVRHDDFSDNNLSNDIALLRMDMEVELTWNIRPVCIPDDSNWDMTFFDGSDGQRGSVAGWGVIKEEGPNSAILLKADIPFMNVSICRQVYKNYLPVTDRMVCTLHNSSDGSAVKDTCKGDSGGALIVLDAESRWTQVGITSFGQGCGRSGYPGVYTRVSQYLYWIYLKIIQTEVSIAQ